MPDGDVDVSIKPDELKALGPRLDEITAAIEQMGRYLGENDTTPAHFGRTPNAQGAGSFVVQRRGVLADTTMAADFVRVFKEALLAAAEGHEDTEQVLSDKFKKIDGGK